MKNLSKSFESLDLTKFEILSPEELSGGKAPDNGDTVGYVTYDQFYNDGSGTGSGSDTTIKISSLDD